MHYWLVFHHFRWLITQVNSFHCFLKNEQTAAIFTKYVFLFSNISLHFNLVLSKGKTYFSEVWFQHKNTRGISSIQVKILAMLSSLDICCGLVVYLGNMERMSSWKCTLILFLDLSNFNRSFFGLLALKQTTSTRENWIGIMCKPQLIIKHIKQLLWA